jgi:hypothetical protein
VNIADRSIGVNSHLCGFTDERVGELDAREHVPHLGDDGRHTTVRAIDVQPHAFPRT